jgi:lipopolysaccharide assembly protein A
MRAMRVLRLLIVIPALVLLVLFALSNTSALRLGLWPTDYALELPASIAILGAMAVAFLAGAFVVWIGELGRRRRARQAELAVKLLEDQVKALKARVLPPNATQDG